MEPNHFTAGNIIYFFITPFIHLLYSLFDKVNFIHLSIVEHIKQIHHEIRRECM